MNHQQQPQRQQSQGHVGNSDLDEKSGGGQGDDTSIGGGGHMRTKTPGKQNQSGSKAAKR